MESPLSGNWVNFVKVVGWLTCSSLMSAVLGAKYTVEPELDTTSAILLLLIGIFSFLAVGAAMVYAIRAMTPQLCALEKGKPLIKFFPYITSLAFWDIVAYGHEVIDGDGHPNEDGDFRPATFQTGLDLEEANDKMCAIYEMIRDKGAVALKMPDGSLWCCHSAQMWPSDENFDHPAHPDFVKAKLMFDPVMWDGEGEEGGEEEEGEGKGV